jgi:hypothetical protein
MSQGVTAMPSDTVTINLHHMAVSVQERISRQREPALAPGKTEQSKNSFTLPEDVVSLSSVRPAPVEAAAGEKPSFPAKDDKSNELRKSFSIFA